MSVPLRFEHTYRSPISDHMPPRASDKYLMNFFLGCRLYWPWVRTNPHGNRRKRNQMLVKMHFVCALPSSAYIYAWWIPRTQIRARFLEILSNRFSRYSRKKGSHSLAREKGGFLIALDSSVNLKFHHDP